MALAATVGPDHAANLDRAGTIQLHDRTVPISPLFFAPLLTPAEVLFFPENALGGFCYQAMTVTRFS